MARIILIKINQGKMKWKKKKTLDKIVYWEAPVIVMSFVMYWSNIKDRMNTKTRDSCLSVYLPDEERWIHAFLKVISTKRKAKFCRDNYTCERYEPPYHPSNG